jgi:hypothetical protein
VPIDPIASDIRQTLQLYPDVSADFLISKSGSFRVTFFYTQNTDMLVTQLQNGRRGQSAGAKLAYRKEFTSLSEFLFGRKKGKLKEAQPVKDSTPVLTTNSGQ